MEAKQGGVRELAIEQLQRKRRFVGRCIGVGTAIVVLAVIWATTEYHNAGGWPSHGFSQSSSIPHVWNIWIVYPVAGLLVFLVLDAWNTFGRKPLTEREIQREMDRLSHQG
ncbi:MAG TPA: 2TM domain-containing protein [Gaiellaceae bacterium]|nr:2TM domain-containing protein [Gaiellaceae bacterium]